MKRIKKILYKHTFFALQSVSRDILNHQTRNVIIY